MARSITWNGPASAYTKPVRPQARIHVVLELLLAVLRIPRMHQAIDPAPVSPNLSTPVLPKSMLHPPWCRRCLEHLGRLQQHVHLCAGVKILGTGLVGS